MSQKRVADLLFRWEALRAQGRKVSAEELCRDYPDLLGQVKVMLRAHEAASAGADLPAHPPAELEACEATTVTHIKNEFPATTVTYRPAEGTDIPPSPVSAVSVPGYELLGELGRGGMGVVYKARHVGLKRLVALKMILTGGLAGAHEKQRFRSEAEAVARLRHANIVQIYDIGDADGHPYFSLEYCDGGSLAKQLAGTPLRPRQAAILVEQLARAMQAAHQAGVIHRDLKPGNILLQMSNERMTNDEKSAKEAAHKWTWDHEEDPSSLGFRASFDIRHSNYVIPKITDFGLAKLLEGEPGALAPDGLTQSGAIMGTPSYMAPEQAGGKNKEVGPWTDVYALGAILYECLTGRPPFKAATPMETVLQVVSADPVPVRQLQDMVPEDVETICMKCLQKKPDKRYASAAALADDLRRYQAGEPIMARPVGQVERFWKWVLRNKELSGGLAAAVLALVLGTAVAWRQAVRANKEAADSGIAAGKEAHQRELAEAALKSAVEARTSANINEQIAKENEQLARTNEEKALRQEKLTRLEKDRADHQLKIAELRQYARQLAQAQQEWQDGNGSGALDILNDCQWNLRHVEYRLLWTLYNTPKGQEVGACKGHALGVACVAFSSDGQRIVSGGLDSTLKVWDAATAQEILSVKGHADGVRGVAFSPDGKRIVSSGGDGALKVWEAATGKQVLSLKGTMGRVTSVVFSPDGKRIISGSEEGPDSFLKSWDAATGEVVLSVKAHTFPPTSLPFFGRGATSVACSFDGKRLLSGSQDTLKVWDAATGQEVLSIKRHTHTVTSAAFSPDGKRLVSGGEDKMLKVWDATTGQEVLSLKGHTGRVTSVAFTIDGKRLVSAGEDKTLKVWDAEKGLEVLSLKGHELAVSCMALSADGKRIVSGSADKTLKVWNAEKFPKVLSLNGHTGAVSCLAMSPDGTRIVSGDHHFDKSVGAIIPGGARAANGDRQFDNPGELKLWDAKKGQEVLSIKGHARGVFSVAFSPDGKRIVSGGGSVHQPGELKVWDAETGRAVLSIQGQRHGVSAVAFSPDGKRILSGGPLKIWDADSGQEALFLKGPSIDVASVACSPDGKRIVNGTAQGKLLVWDVGTGEEVLSLKGHTGTVTSVAFSPDGQRIASGGERGMLKMWNADTGQEIRSFKGHPSGSVLSVTFSPDGQRIVSGGDDRTLKVWDAATGQEIHSFKGHEGPVTSVAFSPDGQRVFSGSDDRTLKVWDTNE